MPVVRVERSVDAPPMAVWAAISDVESISEVAPNVSRAVAEGSGEGMHRRCWDGAGNHWDETCVRWEDGRHYTFDVDTTTSGSRIHTLFHRFAGTFGVDERGAASTLWVEFDLTPRFGPAGSLLLRLMVGRFREVVGTMVDNWVARVEERDAVGVDPSPAG